MAEFKLDKFKYVWKGDWLPGEDYLRDDVVRVNGKSYVCIVTHTSSGAFQTDLEAILPGSNPPQPYPHWTVMTSGKSFIGNWTQGTAYNLGDIVLYNGSLYICTDSHFAGGFSNDITNWEMFALGQEFLGDWQSGTSYAQGGIVKYNGIVYQCKIAHTSAGTLENNINDWEEFHVGVEYQGTWTGGNSYRKNDLVRYGANIYRCTETHTALGLVLDLLKFQLEFPGTQANLAIWDPETNYQEGDVVRYGGYVYFATVNNLDVDPSRTAGDSTTAWAILAKNSSFAGEFVAGTRYKTGEIVLRGGYLYRALQDINISDGSDSTVDYLDDSLWELVATGNKWSEVWEVGTRYSVGEVVYYKGSAYVCTFEHDATQRDNPQNGSGYDYWDLAIQAGRPAGMGARGDLLTYNVTDDGSTFGDVGLAIGNERQVLSVTEDHEVFWRTYARDAEAVYVSSKGHDMPNFGISWKYPFRTIRHACEYIEDTFPAGTLAKVYVAAGLFQEVGPIVVPAGTVIMGDELRATTVEATPAIPEYTDNFQYVKQIDEYISNFILDIITNVPISKHAENPYEQNLLGPYSDQATAETILELITDYETFIEFRVESGDTDPTETGSNTISSDTGRLAASQQLFNNKYFIAEEVYARLVEDNPGVSFTKRYQIADVTAMIRGIAYDLKYSGNHRTLYAARRYYNSAAGSQLDDLLRMRDTTGLRNMTTRGLTGTLNPPGVFDLYQRPTGGALVALDPGWGPDDERAWITNRSPYMQGITNFGTACSGCKIDGNLHNGGLRSMVANDFTQVLSDGVGAWVLNNARCELVSVFTYYCSVGYLAESGGVIRATNGNNSYGSFGSVSAGGDPTEVPQSCTLMNRNNEAQVEKVFAGGSDDRIFAFEYSHTGEHYTTASSTVVGAGAQVETEFTDFRDGALFNARLINTQGSGREGGSNYLTRQGYAQDTLDASSTITLSNSDETQFLSEIQGMRIIILSGLGVGQYGYVTGFDAVSKELTVAKESDGSAGWDHIVPGTAIEASLDPTSYYRIEARVEANHPGYTATNQTIIDLDYVSADFGGTSALYNGLIGQTGTGETFGLDPIASTWRVNREGPTYTVTVINPGAGYAVGDTITIDGTNLGGASPDNDLVITVTGVTDDSSNSIASFTQAGEPVGGLFVAIDDQSAVAYSANGTTWQQANLSFAAGTDSYIKVLAEDNKFLAFATGLNTYSFSYTAETWTTRSLPLTRDWTDAAYGNDTFVLIADNSAEALYSTDGGLSFSQTSMPQIDAWAAVAYGQGSFVAVTSGATQDVATSDDGITWTLQNAVLPAASKTWIRVIYGKNRFVAIAEDGYTAYSLDKGQTWTAGGNANVSGSFNVKNAMYAQGVFFVVGWASQVVAGGIVLEGHDELTTSEDGINWTTRSSNLSYKWQALAYARIDGAPLFMAIAAGATGGLIHLETGCQAKLRGDINQGAFTNMLIWDPGSGYDETNNPLVITVTDNQFVSEVETDNRIGVGVLAQPDFINRGGGYRVTSTTVTITGDGYADIIPEEGYLTLAGVQTIPGPGVQIKIDTVLDEETADPDDLKLFAGIEITDLGDDGSGNGTRLVKFRVSPRLQNEYNLEHGTEVTLRSRYSQCRVSGHDFLDIGTGNFEETNYPEIYAGGNYFVAAPENEVLEQDGGRVFYVSTDQDGNFRTGELFSVQQSTGIVTISADYFDLDGLSELALGGVRLGGSGTVIREFSTDPTFAEDSNNVIPTQRAIAQFLADRLSVGGENLETNAVQAGTVKIGTIDNIIESASSNYINFPVDVSMDGTYTSVDEFEQETTHPVAVQGTIYLMQQIMKGHDDSVQ